MTYPGHPSCLLIRRKPSEHESFKGFLLDTAHLNGLPNIRWILRSANLTAQFVTTPCDLKTLARLIDCSSIKLEELSCWLVPGAPGMVKFGFTEIHGLDIDLVHPKVCPLCLLEERPILNVWDLSASTACPIHGCILIDHCPQCLKRLSWYRPEPGKCKCGANLLEAERFNAPEEAATFASWIDSFVQNSAPPVAARKLVRQIHSLADLLILVRFFGIDPKAGQAWRKSYLSKPVVADSLDANVRAASVLMNWPTGLYDWLERSRTRKTGMDADLGAALRRLRGAFKGPQFQFLTDAVSEYLADEWDGGLVKRWAHFYAAPSGPRCMVGVKTASKLLSTSLDQVGRMLERGELKGVNGKKREAKLVEPGSLAQLLADRHLAVSTSQLAQSLKIHRKQVGKLRNCGFLRPSHRTRSGYMFPPHSIDEFVNSLQRQSKRSSGMTDGICLSDIPSWRKVPLTDVLGMIEKRQVALLAKSASGKLSFKHLTVSKAEILKSAAAKEYGEMLTVREAAKSLGVTVRMIPLLVRAGCLECNQGDDGRLRKRGVSEASVLRFPQTYALASIMAKATNTSTAAISRTLNLAGIQPVIGSNTSKGISAVWRRADVVSVFGRIE